MPVNDFLLPLSFGRGSMRPPSDDGPHGLSISYFGDAAGTSHRIGNRRYGAARSNFAASDYTLVTDNDGLIYPSRAADEGTGSVALDIPHTWSFWVNIYTMPAGTTDYFFARRLGSGDGSGFASWILASGAVYYRLATSISPALHVQANSSVALSADGWYHIALSYDGSGDATGINIFVNGVECSADHAESGTYAGLKPRALGAASHRTRRRPQSGGRRLHRRVRIFR